jgi:hypothetical protein
VVGRLLANRTASPFSGVAGMPRNQGLASVGITGCFASESPAALRRKARLASVGIRTASGFTPRHAGGTWPKWRMRSKTERAAFIETYSGTVSGQRLHRGLARMLADDPAMMAFFDSLISSGDEK